MSKFNRTTPAVDNESCPYPKVDGCSRLVTMGGKNAGRWYLIRNTDQKFVRFLSPEDGEENEAVESGNGGGPIRSTYSQRQMKQYCGADDIRKEIDAVKDAVDNLSRVQNLTHGTYRHFIDNIDTKWKEIDDRLTKIEKGLDILATFIHTMNPK